MRLLIALDNFKIIQIINFNILTDDEIQAIKNVFETIKSVDFPSLLEQFEQRFWARIELDKIFLRLIGFNNKEINDWLLKIYDALVDEFNAMKGVK